MARIVAAVSRWNAAPGGRRLLELSSWSRLPSRNYSLLVPNLEARDVHLDRRLTVGRRHPLEDELRFGDDLLAAVARLACTGPAPDPGDAVIRKSAISKFVAYEMPERLRVHGGSLSSRGGGNAKLTGVSTPKGVNPKGRGAGPRSVLGAD